MALKSPTDARDWIYEEDVAITSGSVVKSFPPILDMRHSLQPIRSQGRQGTCMAQSAACMKEWQETKSIDLCEYFSPQFIYNNRSNFPDAGMYGRDLMKILSNVGCCRESLFPYGEDKTNTTTSDAVRDAANFKISGYAQVTTENGLKSALCNTGPCLITFPVYVDAGDTFWKAKSSDEIKGGHAVTVIGYNHKGFILRNSWGRKYANDGYIVFPYADFGAQWEIWATVDAESVRPKGGCGKSFITKLGVCCRGR